MFVSKTKHIGISNSYITIGEDICNEKGMVLYTGTIYGFWRGIHFIDNYRQAYWPTLGPCD